MDGRTRARIRDALLAAGVRNLKEFGYPKCNQVNILTDAVYSAFFKKMLEDDESTRADVVTVRAELLAEISEHTKESK